MKHCFTVFLLVVGVAIASTGLAALFGVAAASAMDWSWNGVSIRTHDWTINGKAIPRAISNAILIALPVVVMFVGLALAALGWRGCRAVLPPRTAAAHQS